LGPCRGHAAAPDQPEERRAGLPAEVEYKDFKVARITFRTGGKD